MAFTRSIVRERGQSNINVNPLTLGGTEQGVELAGSDAPPEKIPRIGPSRPAFRPHRHCCVPLFVRC